MISERFSVVILEGKRLGRLFMYASLRDAALSLLGLFSPIYILQSSLEQGYDLQTGVVFVISFYTILFISKIFSLIMSENLSQKMGYKHIIRLSFIPFLACIPFIILIKQNIFFGVFAAILWGIDAGMYWWGYHGYFIKNSMKGRWGKEIGGFEFMLSLPRILTPLSGAIIVSIFGFNALFILVAAFMLLAMLLFGRGSDEPQKVDVKASEVLKIMWNRKSVSAAYIGQGADALFHTIFWPMFLFILFGQVLTVGTIFSGAILFSAAVALFTGIWIDKRGIRQIIATSSIIISLTWLIRFVVNSVGAIILVDTASRIANKMSAVSLDGQSYKKAMEKNISQALLFRELNLAFGYLVAAVGVGIISFIDPSLRSVLLLAAIMTLLPQFAVINKKL